MARAAETFRGARFLNGIIRTLNGIVSAINGIVSTLHGVDGRHGITGGTVATLAGGIAQHSRARHSGPQGYAANLHRFRADRVPPFCRRLEARLQRDAAADRVGELAGVREPGGAARPGPARRGKARLPVRSCLHP